MRKTNKTTPIQATDVTTESLNYKTGDYFSVEEALENEASIRRADIESLYRRFRALEEYLGVIPHVIPPTKEQIEYIRKEEQKS